MNLEGIHHVQLAMPPGGEDRASAFYSGVLGMEPVPKPEPMRGGGGAWFRAGAVELHLGIEDDHTPARKAHPALRVDDLDAFAKRLESGGHPVEWDTRFPGVRRFYVSDPFGNRLELLEAAGRSDGRSVTPESTRAEFTALRQEIQGRSGQQLTLLGLNLTALSGIVGFVLSDSAPVELLLLLPIVASCIGLLWYDHARNIESLGDHIRTTMPELSSYELRIERLERAEFRRVPMTLALLGLFVGAPLAGLVLTLDVVTGLLWALWGTGFALSLVCTGFLLRWMAAGLRE